MSCLIGHPLPSGKGLLPCRPRPQLGLGGVVCRVLVQHNQHLTLNQLLGLQREHRLHIGKLGVLGADISQNKVIHIVRSGQASLDCVRLPLTSSPAVSLRPVVYIRLILDVSMLVPSLISVLVHILRNQNLKLKSLPPSSPICPGVRKGVPRTVLGVAIILCCGVTPLKSDSCRGAFRPPFRGVSTEHRRMTTIFIHVNGVRFGRLGLCIWVDLSGLESTRVIFTLITVLGFVTGKTTNDRCTLCSGAANYGSDSSPLCGHQLGQVKQFLLFLTTPFCLLDARMR
ncbi:hypothetical protein MAR_019406 [Mya arenaria]|uniref:Uncharacterized protein n=1 Tax=Mya arenaria TaxID=6604 RepID=A0ABY7EHI4_MYAAR|nr:hypothetical protein MAR_019406 [Mya arenaria]